MSFRSVLFFLICSFISNAYASTNNINFPVTPHNLTPKNCRVEVDENLFIDFELSKDGYSEYFSMKDEVINCPAKWDLIIVEGEWSELLIEAQQPSVNFSLTIGHDPIPSFVIDLNEGSGTIVFQSSSDCGVEDGVFYSVKCEPQSDDK